jgi:hypothetical protein
MTVNQSPHDSQTLAAIGALAYCVSDVVHEVLGHAGSCVLSGGQVALLSSAWFRCQGGGVAADLGGPIANLLAGGLLWLALSCGIVRIRPQLRLLVLLTLVFNLFWAGGGMLYSALTGQDDGALLVSARQPPWLYRVILFVCGLLLYRWTMRLLAREIQPFLDESGRSSRPRSGRLLLVPYLAAGIAACLAALTYGPDALGAVQEAALESFAANIGLLFLYRRASPPAVSAGGRLVIHRSPWLLTAAILGCIAFTLTLGHGYGSRS